MKLLALLVGLLLITGCTTTTLTKKGDECTFTHNALLKFPKTLTIEACDACLELEGRGLSFELPFGHVKEE